jgi:AcrR family transcriptional regulator
MARRRAWNGNPPESPAEARRILLEAARSCLERIGPEKAGLSDVARDVGVTRQTVYRYFEDVDDLFRSAAVLASGGFHERLRLSAMRRSTPAERMVECILYCVREIPDDPNLRALSAFGEHFAASTLVELGFVQEEIRLLAEGDPGLTREECDELAELMLRLMVSLLQDPLPGRDEEQLEKLLMGWLVPMIDARRQVGRGA